MRAIAFYPCFEREARYSLNGLHTNVSRGFSQMCLLWSRLKLSFFEASVIDSMDL